MNIFVGNLHVNASEKQLQDLFGKFGAIVSLRIVMERNGGQSKGFGFVEMGDHNAGEEAIKKLNNRNFMNQFLEVSEAMATGGNYFFATNADKRSR